MPALPAQIAATIHNLPQGTKDFLVQAKGESTLLEQNSSISGVYRFV